MRRSTLTHLVSYRCHPSEEGTADAEHVESSPPKATGGADERVSVRRGGSA